MYLLDIELVVKKECSECLYIPGGYIRWLLQNNCCFVRQLLGHWCENKTDLYFDLLSICVYSVQIIKAASIFFLTL